MEENLKKKKGKIKEYIEALVTAVLIAFVIRSFIIEPFKIPSSSMVPTLMIGDHIFVNKFIYGLRPPFTKKHFFQFRTPERGEVIVFIYPEDESKDFIKRVIGLPGDKVKVEGTDVYVNGDKLKHEPIIVGQSPADKRALLVKNDAWPRNLPFVPRWENFNFYKETEDDVKHLIQYEKDVYFRPLGHFMSANGGEITVPEGKLFCMGDNRDNSSDGREWGFVPMENIKGKAMFVWLSLDSDNGWLRWKRFGSWIN
ncbi:MAG: signal peptidase I [Deltaproteobacteria bacterium CG11_big_fil_rev_8_21_14_0_20_49_13]|nr:MAG: signal peptidase I [Deltaproteobacteria bacterium CG11_big_fil_rev_8_21_14_0_20_49_13]